MLFETGLADRVSHEIRAVVARKYCDAHASRKLSDHICMLREGCKQCLRMSGKLPPISKSRYWLPDKLQCVAAMQ